MAAYNRLHRARRWRIVRILPGVMRISMRTLAAAGLAIMVVAPALEADSSHGVLRIGADVTAHCAVATAATVSGPASIRCSKNAASAVAASVDGRRPTVVELQEIGPSVVGAGVSLSAHPSSVPVRVLSVQF